MVVPSEPPEKEKTKKKQRNSEPLRTGNFLPGGAVNHLPKKLLQVAQIFTKQSNRNEGHTMQQHRPY